MPKAHCGLSVLSLAGRAACQFHGTLIDKESIRRLGLVTYSYFRDEQSLFELQDVVYFIILRKECEAVKNSKTFGSFHSRVKLIPLENKIFYSLHPCTRPSICSGASICFHGHAAERCAQ